jgi:arginine/lysine/ornithine decarboxylase
MLIPGENIGAADGLFLAYLKALGSFDLSFPGFTHAPMGSRLKAGFIRCCV